MKITFKNAVRIDNNTVRSFFNAEYLINEGTEKQELLNNNFYVSWSNIDVGTGKTIQYYLEDDGFNCKVSDYDYGDISDKVNSAIRSENETDLYLALRDSFNSDDCESAEIPKIISAEYEPDIGSLVTVKAGNKEYTVIVQLVGGEHLVQMGCWLTCEQLSGYGDISLDGTELEDIDIISAGELSYDKYVEELKGEGWEDVDHNIRTYTRVNSATSSQSLVIQEKNGEFRYFIEAQGFTQPNDYSCNPDLEIFDGFDSVEAIERRIKLAIEAETPNC